MIGPRFEEISTELGLLSKFRDKPAGRLRITAGEHAAITILQPALEDILAHHPDIHIEIIVDYGLTDIVAEGYDAGVRLGEQVAKDMIAVRVGPDMRVAVVDTRTLRLVSAVSGIPPLLSQQAPDITGFHGVPRSPALSTLTAISTRSKRFITTASHLPTLPNPERKFPAGCVQPYAQAKEDVGVNGPHASCGRIFE